MKVKLLRSKMTRRQTTKPKKINKMSNMKKSLIMRSIKRTLTMLTRNLTWMKSKKMIRVYPNKI